MEAGFWHSRWESGDIGFHEAEVNPLLTAYIAELANGGQSRVFIPLCGKTNDIAWLMNEGYSVVGVELSLLAIDQLFESLNVIPSIEYKEGYSIYRHHNIEVFVGDIFNVPDAEFGVIDCVYDRAALVALPNTLRTKYAEKIVSISQCAPQLLITFDFDQSVRQGPPFALSSDQIHQLYAHHYQLIELDHSDDQLNAKEFVPVRTTAWHLNPV